MIITSYPRLLDLLHALDETKQLNYIAIEQGQIEQYLSSPIHPPINPPAALIAPRGERKTLEDKQVSHYTAEIDIHLLYETSLIANVAAPDTHFTPLEKKLQLIDTIISTACERGWQLVSWEPRAQIESLSETVIRLARREWLGDS